MRRTVGYFEQVGTREAVRLTVDYTLSAICMRMPLTLNICIFIYDKTVGIVVVSAFVLF